jgi:putative endonuclease
MLSTHEKGNNGEDIAIDHLIKNGYVILERNWRHHHHELDIVAQKKNLILIIEVKSLNSNKIQEPYQSVNLNKQQMIISAANAYIRKNNIDFEVRFDIISILYKDNEPQIEHIENAFYPRMRTR